MGKGTYGMNIRNGNGARWNTIQKTDKNGFSEKQGPRFLGLGKHGGTSREERKNRLIGAIQNAQNTPTYNVPTIDNVTLHFDGPLTDSAIAGTFGRPSIRLGPIKAAHLRVASRSTRPSRSRGSFRRSPSCVRFSGVSTSSRSSSPHRSTAGPRRRRARPSRFRRTCSRSTTSPSTGRSA